MPKKQSRAELEAEIAVLRRNRNSSNLANVVNNIIRWGGAVAIAYIAYLAIDSLSGETTTADIGIKLFAGVKLSEVFAYIFGGGGVAYGYAQKQLRQSTIERLQGRIKTLESKVDKNRTSSGLTPRGNTHPKDQ